MNEEGVQQLPSHVAIYCYINVGCKREECCKCIFMSNLHIVITHAHKQ